MTKMTQPLFLHRYASVCIKSIKACFLLTLLLCSVRAPLSAAPEDFTLVVIPDTQFMVCYYKGGIPEMFNSQVNWIKNNVSTLNIKMVSHVGDIADASNDPAQWARVATAIGDLENNVPFGMAYGNHDYCIHTPSYQLNKAWLENGFNPTFPLSDFSGKSWFGGNYPAGKMDNNYELFSGGGVDFIIIHLGDNPDAAARSWASGVLDAYPDRKAIISTHSYMGGGVYNNGPGSIWYDVVKSHNNVFMVICGHDCAREATVVWNNDFGNPVYQILTDYQCDDPQPAYLRYYTFVPSENKIKAYTYSPYNNNYENDANSRFDIPFTFVTGPVAPALISTSPKDNSSRIATMTSNIILTFNSNMNGTSVANNTTVSGSGITGVTYLSGNSSKTITLKLTGTLQPSTPYKIIVNKDAATVGGTTLALTRTNDFTTTASLLVPGKIQVEEYLGGGEGFGYHDTTTGNSGSSTYRSDDVDMEACSDTGGGINIGWTAASEWLAYEVDIATSANYDIIARIASGAVGTKSFSVEIDGVNVSGTVQFTGSAGWQVWNNLKTSTNLPLTVGKHRMRINMLSADFNLNYLTITNVGTSVAEPTFVGSVPANNQVVLPQVTSITLLFNTNMNGASVAASSTLTGTGVSGVSYSGGNGTKRIVLNISGTLQSNSTYSFSLSTSAQSSSGQNITSPVSFIFKTPTSDTSGGLLVIDDFADGNYTANGSWGTWQNQTGSGASAQSIVTGVSNNGIRYTYTYGTYNQLWLGGSPRNLLTFQSSNIRFWIKGTGTSTVKFQLDSTLAPANGYQRYEYNLGVLPASWTLVKLNIFKQFTNHPGYTLNQALSNNNGFVWLVAGSAGATGTFDIDNLALVSNKVVVVPPPLPLNGPDELSLVAVSTSRIDLLWSNVSNETGYKIYRGTSGSFSSSSLVGTKGVNQTNFSDTGLIYNRKYHYFVRATNASSTSAYVSNSITTLDKIPVAPTSLQVTAVGASSLKIQWMDNSDNETSFLVFANSTSNRPTASSYRILQNITSFTETGLSTGMVRYYWIASSNALGISPVVGWASNSPNFIKNTSLSTQVEEPKDSKKTKIICVQPGTPDDPTRFYYYTSAKKVRFEIYTILGELVWQSEEIPVDPSSPKNEKEDKFLTGCEWPVSMSKKVAAGNYILIVKEDGSRINRKSLTYINHKNRK